MSGSAASLLDRMRTDFGVLQATDTIRAALRAMDQWPAERTRAVIQRRDGRRVYCYLYVTDELFARLQKSYTHVGWETIPLWAYLELREIGAAASVDRQKPPAHVRGPAVIVSGNKVVGYLGENDVVGLAGGAAREASSLADGIPLSGTLKADLQPPSRERRGGGCKSAGSEGPAKPPKRGGAASMIYVPHHDQLEASAPTESSDSAGPMLAAAPPAPTSPPQKDFSAYPRVDILKDGKQPTTVKRGDALTIIAGFRPDRDVTLADTGAIGVRNVQDGEKCLVHFFLKGLALVQPSQFSNPDLPHWELALAPNAIVPEFPVTVLDNATEVECKVEYYIRGVLAGIASRKLKLASASTDLPKTPKANPCKFNLEDAEPVDLIISITHSQDGRLEFVFSGAAVGGDPARYVGKNDMPDSLELARDLYGTLKDIDFRDTAARDAIDGIGQRIQQSLPEEFFLYVYQAQLLPKPPGRTLPTILLLTDEAYIPWELTLFEDPDNLFDRNAPPYLGAQTIMGRWIPRDYIRMPPAAVCDVNKFQVIASPYSQSATRQRELLAAVEEQKQLLAEYSDWNPESYQARKVDLDKVKADRTKGKAVHFAVHGLSDPAGNKQQLILEDARVSALTLIGAYRCGDTPRFAFVFMNACQVGTPGKILGDIGGFPGELVRGGAYGVIAPLWDVHDEVARACALQFYNAVFREGKSVAEALRERRATYSSDSTTPVAYVYYGHPGLRLKKGGNDG